MQNFVHSQKVFSDDFHFFGNILGNFQIAKFSEIFRFQNFRKFSDFSNFFLDFFCNISPDFFSIEKKYFYFWSYKIFVGISKSQSYEKMRLQWFSGRSGHSLPLYEAPKVVRDPRFSGIRGIPLYRLWPPHGPEPTDPDARDPQLLPIERLWARGA